MGNQIESCNPLHRAIDTMYNHSFFLFFQLLCIACTTTAERFHYTYSQILLQFHCGRMRFFRNAGILHIHRWALYNPPELTAFLFKNPVKDPVLHVSYIIKIFKNNESLLQIPFYLSQSSIIPDISRKIAVSTLRFRLLSLVFALIRQNKGKLFFFTCRPPYPAVLLRSVLLPLSRVRRYSSWYSHPHVPAVPERPSAVRR